MDWKRCTSMVEPNPVIRPAETTPRPPRARRGPPTPPMRAGLAATHGLSEYSRKFPRVFVMSVAMSRVEAVRLLLGSRDDWLPGMATSTGRVVQGSAVRGEVSSSRFVCGRCGGRCVEGRPRRPRPGLLVWSVCSVCDGRGWVAGDAYTFGSVSSVAVARERVTGEAESSKLDRRRRDGELRRLERLAAARAGSLDPGEAEGWEVAKRRLWREGSMRSWSGRSWRCARSTSSTGWRSWRSSGRTRRFGGRGGDRGAGRAGRGVAGGGCRIGFGCRRTSSSSIRRGGGRWRTAGRRSWPGAGPAGRWRSWSAGGVASRGSRSSRPPA
jgi:hypothetical protein